MIMLRLGKLWSRVRTWLSSAFRSGRRPYRVVSVEDLPDRLDSTVLYIVEEGGHRYAAAMICPCGCGATLEMNLVPDMRPLWTATVHEDGTGSLHPSVWRQVGCRAHFWLKRGHVTWSGGA